MNIRNLTPDVSIGAQPTGEEIAHLREQGFSTLVNLRSPDEEGANPDEEGANPDEERLAKESGLNYASIPISPDTISDGDIERLTQVMSSVDASPSFVHCKSGGRASIFALLHLALQNGWSIKKTYDEGRKMNIEVPEDSPYRAFFEDFLRRRSPGER